MSTTPTETLPSPASETPPPGGATGGRTALRVLLALFALLVVAWGAVTVASLLARVTARSNASYHGVRVVDVEASFESVTVVGQTDVTDVSMRRSSTWSFQRPQLHGAVQDGRLLLTSSCPWDIGLGCSGHVDLVVPVRTVVLVHGSDGGVTVIGIHARVEAQTSDGEITVSDVTGPLTISTSDGSVEGSALQSGRVTAHTSDGSVHLSFIRAPASVLAYLLNDSSSWPGQAVGQTSGGVARELAAHVLGVAH
jgi:hypothetical protein